MGRPLEDVSLQKLVKSIREDIRKKLDLIAPGEALIQARKPRRK